jgi:NAD(P)-dependent dehydrogenase (short-subunit alcohol dehydrogenase family)
LLAGKIVPNLGLNRNDLFDRDGNLFGVIYQATPTGWVLEKCGDNNPILVESVVHAAREKNEQRFMVEQQYGKIVAISSRSAMGNRGHVNYSSAKASILGFVRTAAIELGQRNINVNAVAPGRIETAMTRAGGFQPC